MYIFMEKWDKYVCDSTHNVYFHGEMIPFRWFKKGSCQFLVKECAQYWLTA